MRERVLHLGRWERRHLLAAVVAAVALLILAIRVGCIAQDAEQEAVQHFSNIRVERMDLLTETPLSAHPVSIRVASADGVIESHEVDLLHREYDIALSATVMDNGEAYRWNAPLKCFVIRPRDPADAFTWAAWELGARFRDARIHVDDAGAAYFCWLHYTALAIIAIDEPRPMREALVADFAWGFPYPDAIFDAYTDALAGAWKRREWGLWAPIDLVSLERSEGLWDLTVRNPVSGFEYRAQSTDGSRWTGV